MELTSEDIKNIEFGWEHEEGFCVSGKWYVPESYSDSAYEKIAALELELKQKDGIIKNMASNAAQQKYAVENKLRNIERRERALAESADQVLRDRIAALEENRNEYKRKYFDCLEFLRLLGDEIKEELGKAKL